MKLIACVLLAVLAVAVGDEGFYQQQPNQYEQQQFHHQQQHQQQHHQQINTRQDAQYQQQFSAPADTYSNYNNYGQQPPAKQPGFASRLWNRIFGGANRRQGIAGLLGGLGGFAAIGPIVAVVAVVAAIVAVAVVNQVVTEINSSGRGLDSNEWEIDHSVWMDQLHKDFEDSWSVE